MASQKQKAEAEKQHAEAKSEEVRQKREAEAAKRADALRSAAAARGTSVAAEMKQRERELELTRRAEAEAKRERVAAVLAYDETQVDERERQVRHETYVRIRREENRRELALQRQEDGRAERMRLYECGGKYNNNGASNTIPGFVPPPAVQSARSFFSITGSTVSETSGEIQLVLNTYCSRDRCRLIPVLFVIDMYYGWNFYRVMHEAGVYAFATFCRTHQFAGLHMLPAPAPSIAVSQWHVPFVVVEKRLLIYIYTQLTERSTCRL